jgi:hypothetical protein
MTSVPTSSTPAAAVAIPLAALDVDPSAEAGRARATGGVGAPAADVVLAPAAKATQGAKTATAKKTSATTKKTTTKKASTTSKAGYAASTAVPKDLAFLKDAKLSVEEKLLRFLAYMNAKSEAEITSKMQEMAGGTPAKASGSSGTTAQPKKQKGFWGKLLDAAKTGLPALGLSMQLLKNTTTKNMLKQLGGPALAAAATALGFPQAAPLLAKLGPQIVDYAAAGMQAIEKAAAAETSSSSGSGTASTGGTSGAGTGKSEQIQYMELQRLYDKQKEMFTAVSNMLRSMHDTRTSIIANIR